MSTDRWMDKDVVCIYSGMLLSHKKEQNNANCSNMDGPRDYHTKWSVGQKQISYVSLVHVILKIIQINLLTKQK